MNHEVENDIDIERARREDGEPVRLKEHGPPDFWLDRKDGGIEALEMARLQDALAFLSAGDEVVGLRKAGGEGLFNQEVESSFEQSRGHGVMMHSGHGDGCGVEVQIGGQQLLNGREDGIEYFDSASAARAGSGSTAATSATPRPAASSSR